MSALPTLLRMPVTMLVTLCCETYPEKIMATTAHDHDQIDPVRWKSDEDGSGVGGGRKVASMDGYNTRGEAIPAGHSSFAEWSFRDSDISCSPLVHQIQPHYYPQKEIIVSHSSSPPRKRDGVHRCRRRAGRGGGGVWERWWTESGSTRLSDEIYSRAAGASSSKKRRKPSATWRVEEGVRERNVDEASMSVVHPSTSTFIVYPRPLGTRTRRCTRPHSSPLRVPICSPVFLDLKARRRAITCVACATGSARRAAGGGAHGDRAGTRKVVLVVAVLALAPSSGADVVSQLRFPHLAVPALLDRSSKTKNPPRRPLVCADTSPDRAILARTLQRLPVHAVDVGERIEELGGTPRGGDHGIREVERVQEGVQETSMSMSVDAPSPSPYSLLSSLSTSCVCVGLSVRGPAGDDEDGDGADDGAGGAHDIDGAAVVAVLLEPRAMATARRGRAGGHRVDARSCLDNACLRFFEYGVGYARLQPGRGWVQRATAWREKKIRLRPSRKIVLAIEWRGSVPSPYNSSIDTPGLRCPSFGAGVSVLEPQSAGMNRGHGERRRKSSWLCAEDPAINALCPQHPPRGSPFACSAVAQSTALL
ncbi:hypothetical protein C8R45DRAFT_1078844 [Mycena sanguinolenta]|nr:hypothetical protein C8R45DRAFT_1078844 [Mycena sanguinolenta]